MNDCNGCSLCGVDWRLGFRASVHSVAVSRHRVMCPQVWRCVRKHPNENVAELACVASAIKTSVCLKALAACVMCSVFSSHVDQRMVVRTAVVLVIGLCRPRLSSYS